MIPTGCTRRIIGRKGKQIKQISRESRATKFSTDTKIVYTKEIRVQILGNQLACLNILQLIRQVHFHQNYPIQIYLEASYIPGMIGKGGQFLKRTKHTAKTGLVKLLPTWPAKERNGMFVIHHWNMYNCIKAVRMFLSKIRTIQSFQQEKLQAKSKILPSGQKVSQSCVLLAEKVNEIADKHTVKKLEPVQMDITKIKDVDKAT